MKKLVLLVCLLATSSAMANDVAAVIGGVILGAIIADNHNHNPPPPPREPPLRPSHNGDYIYRPSEPPVGYPRYEPVYKFVDIYIPECRCYRSVIVQVQ
jgi:hypothetical protein